MSRSKNNRSERSRAWWVWVVSTPIFSLFVSVFLNIFSFLDFTFRVAVVLLAIVLWFICLLVAIIFDWLARRLELMRDISQDDAYMKQWAYRLKINSDGSAEAKRTLEGVNFAENRRKFEFESWTDPERNRLYEARLRRERKQIVDVTVTPSGKSPISIFSSKEVIPIDCHKAHRITHSIPLTDPNRRPRVRYLKPGDEFKIEFIENHEVNTWKIRGDRYRHRVSHPTESLHVEVTFPEDWEFPSESTDNVVGWCKSPTSGEWKRTEEQPELRRGNKAVWEIKRPRLLHIYRFSYSRMRLRR